MLNKEALYHLTTKKMQYLNKVMLLGHLAANPESKKTENGHTLTYFPVATNKTVKHENGKKEEQAQFHKVIAWRGLGDTCAKNLTKGSLVLVEGELSYRKYEDRQVTEIKATKVIFLRIKKNNIEAETAEEEE